MKHYHNQNDAHSRAIYKVKRIKRFYNHLAAYIIVNTLFIVLKIVRNFDNGDNFFDMILNFNFGNLWFIWGIGLAFHAFAVFGTDYFFGKNWEENKINELMKEEEDNINSNSNSMENYKNISENSNNAQANFNKEEAYLRAKKKFDKLKGFYWHLAAYIVVNIFLIVMVTTHLDEGESFWQFETFATPIFWGIGLAFHAMGVFGPDLLFGKNWKKRKIDDYMNKDKRHWE